MGLKERSRERRRRIVGNVANSHEEAEQWDLEFWQSLTPQQRLFVNDAIRRAVTDALRQLGVDPSHRR